MLSWWRLGVGGRTAVPPTNILQSPCRGGSRLLRVRLNRHPAIAGGAGIRQAPHPAAVPARALPLVPGASRSLPFPPLRSSFHLQNTGSNEFRKVNVDVYDEDNYVDDVAATELTDADVSAKESAAREHLNTGGKPEALRAALANPPLGAADGPLKDRVAKVVMDVLSAFKADEVKKCVSAMTEGEKDIAMKYIYKGMAAPETYNSAVLLVWHGAVSPPPHTRTNLDCLPCYPPRLLWPIVDLISSVVVHLARMLPCIRGHVVYPSPR